MATRLKAAAVGSVRRGVPIPTPRAVDIRKVNDEADAREQLRASYNRFLGEDDPSRKDKAGKDLIRAIFGTDAIAEDSVC